MMYPHCLYTALFHFSSRYSRHVLCTSDFFSCFDPILVLFTAPMHYRTLHILLRSHNHTVMLCHLNLHRNNMQNMFICCDMCTVCSALSLCTGSEFVCNMCLCSTYILSDPALMSQRQIAVHLLHIDCDCEWIIECRSPCLLSSVSPLASRLCLENSFPR